MRTLGAHSFISVVLLFTQALALATDPTLCSELLAPKKPSNRIALALHELQNQNWSAALGRLRGIPPQIAAPQSTSPQTAPLNTTTNATTPRIDAVELGQHLAQLPLFFSPYDGPVYAQNIARVMAARQARGLDVSLDLPRVPTKKLDASPLFQPQLLARFPDAAQATLRLEQADQAFTQNFEQITLENNPFPIHTLEVSHSLVPFTGGQMTKVFTTTLPQNTYLELFGRHYWTTPQTENPQIIVRFLHQNHRQAIQIEAVRRTLAAGILHEYLETNAAPRSRWVSINGKLAVASEYVRGLQAYYVTDPIHNVAYAPGAALGEFFVGNQDNHQLNYMRATSTDGQSHLVFYDHNLAFSVDIPSPLFWHAYPFGSLLPPVGLWPPSVAARIRTLSSDVINDLVGGLLSPSEIQGLNLRAELLQSYLSP